jgi:hypothetical protein
MRHDIRRSNWQAAALLMVSCLPYSWTLKVEAIRSSQMAVKFYQTTRRCNREDRTLEVNYYLCNTDCMWLSPFVVNRHLTSSSQWTELR